MSFLVILAMVLTMLMPGTVFAEDPPGGAPESDTIIDISEIGGVTVPERGETPVSEITETDQYTGTVAWDPADATFAAETVYTATIELTAKEGYTLTGVEENFFTVDGTSAPAENDADSGVITAVFPATEADFYVDDSYTAGDLDSTHFNTIQEAIDMAAPGAYIKVAEGTYTENVDIDKNGLILKGAGDEDTFIVATEANEYPLEFISNDATVDGFTMKHEYDEGELAAWNLINNDGVRFVSGNNNTLINSTVTLNRNGIYFNNTQNNKVKNCIITNNRTGINMRNYLNGTVIEGNTISNNWTIGIVMYGVTTGSGITLTGNTFDQNWYSEILIKADPISGEPPVSGTNIIDVTNNIFTDSPVTYTTSAHDSLNEPLHEDLRPDFLGGTEPEYVTTKPAVEYPTLRVYNNPVFTLQYDDNKTLRVGAADPAHPTDPISPDKPYTSIQAAVDDAAPYDTITVSAGLYEENVLIDKPLTLLGATHGIDKTTSAYDNVTTNGAWSGISGESVIQSPDPTQDMSAVVDINRVSDVTFAGFVVQELNAVGAQYDSLVRVTAQVRGIATGGPIENINVINNVIGPFTNIGDQDGSHGRMGLYIVNDPYHGDIGVINSTFAYNKIFGTEGNGNNVFIWSAYSTYGAITPCPMTGTAIEHNDIYGSHRSGIETAGGFTDLVIRNNTIHDNGLGVTSSSLTYGNGITLIRGSGDKDDPDAYGPVDLTIEDNIIYNNSKNGIYSGPMIEDTLITGNTIRDNGWYGVVVDLEGKYHGVANYGRAEDVTVARNTITGNTTGAAVQGDPENDFILYAAKNWWGATSGAVIAGMVEGAVEFDPWYTGVGAGSSLASDKPIFNATQETSHNTIKEAVEKASSGDVINVAAGLYTEPKIVIDKNLTIIGAGNDLTTISPSVDISGDDVNHHHDNNAWFLVSPGATFNLSNVTLDGTGKRIPIAIISHGSGIIENNSFVNISKGTGSYRGIAIDLLGSDMTVRNNSFSNIERIGVFTGYNTVTSAAIITGNTYQGKGSGEKLDYAFEVGRGGHAVITGNAISGNRGVAHDNSSSSGILVTSYYESGTPAHATISGNTITGCAFAVYVGYGSADGSVVTVSENNLADNDIGIKSTNPTVDGRKNWWGTTSSAAIQGLITGDVNYDPWYNSLAMDTLASAKSVINTTQGTSHDTIQAAIDAATAGAIITVAAGNYPEALTVNESVELRGAQYGVDARDRSGGAAESIISYEGAIRITANEAVIDGFTIAAPSVWNSLISPKADNIVIQNNIIKREIYLETNISDLSIRQNWFKDIVYDNVSASAISSDLPAGIYRGLSIQDNKFTDIDYSAIILGTKNYRDTVVSGNAIYRTGAQAINLAKDHNNTVINGNYIQQANMSGEQDKGGIRIYGTDFTGTVTITNNTVVDSFNGFCVKNEENITGKDIIVENNTFIENINAGVYNGASFGAINASNNYWGTSGPAISGNVNYFPWYVDTTKTRLINQGYHLTSPGKGRSSVILSWTGAPGVDGYNVYNGTTKVNSSLITGTTYTVVGLSSSTTYSFSLKAMIGGIEKDINDPALSVTTNSGGGGTTPPPAPPAPPEQPPAPPAPPALQDPKTPDDQKLIDNIASSGNASLDLSGSANNKAGLSADIITQLSQENAPLTIQNEGLKVDFAPGSLITPELGAALGQAGATVEIGAQQVSEEEKQEILASAPLGESTGIFEVGGVIVDLTANIVSGDTATKIEEFAEPVAVTIDLSGLNLTPEQISQLSGVRYEKDADGNIVPVPLGGTYDPVSKTFTFYTTKFSLYSVVQVPALVTIELFIGNNVAKVKGTETDIDVPPYIINGRTMAPLRFIGEAMGAEFVWDEAARTVTFTLKGKELKLVIDQLVPGMDVPAVIVNNRTLVPVRYLAEAFGAEVSWFGKERKVLVVK